MPSPVDDLAELGEWVKTPEANVVPNISASIPQLVACINELQAQGYSLPDYPIAPENDGERAIAARYDAIKGSAVNPVRGEGTSDRAVRPRSRYMLKTTCIVWGFGTLGQRPMYRQCHRVIFRTKNQPHLPPPKPVSQE